VNGVYLAFAQESYHKGSSARQKLQVDKAEANVIADKSMFEFPASAPAVAPTK
jgi:hypothetical protein